MINLKEILNPKVAYNKIKSYMSVTKNRKKYNSIVDSLEREGKIQEIGFSKVGKNLYVGIDLDPTLLRPDFFDEEARGSAELKFVSEKLKKYTDFLNKEGILDYSIADYDRFYDKKDYYGYIVEIKFNDKLIKKEDLRYGIVYIVSAIAVLSSLAWLIFNLVS